MKKILSLAMALIMALSLAACGGGGDGADGGDAAGGGAAGGGASHWAGDKWRWRGGLALKSRRKEAGGCGDPEGKARR